MNGDRVAAAGLRALELARKLEDSALGAVHRVRLALYRRSDRRPWRAGYTEHRAHTITQILADPEMLATLAEGRPLPPRYGVRVDARCVEIPWVLSRLLPEDRLVLDAGSALNHEFVVGSALMAGRRLHVLTLAPEKRAFWTLGVSYLYGDLRRTALRDDYFDAVACISTIEHVGMDNEYYAEGREAARPGASTDHLEAVKELRRVLRPGGRLLITFPFGRYENHGWFQQLDAGMVDGLREAFAPARSAEHLFRYGPDGWQRSDRASCAGCEFFDVRASRYFDPRSSLDFPPDGRAGEQAVACLELQK
jgi:SAM-dependent methyltransferase